MDRERIEKAMVMLRQWGVSDRANVRYRPPVAKELPPERECTVSWRENSYRDWLDASEVDGRTLRGVRGYAAFVVSDSGSPERVIFILERSAIPTEEDCEYHRSFWGDDEPMEDPRYSIAVELPLTELEEFLELTVPYCK